MAANFADVGGLSLKNIVRPVRVYRAELGGERATQPAPTLSMPDKPSIAVLPFANMSGEIASLAAVIASASAASFFWLLKYGSPRYQAQSP